jgi:hypothetical protein
MPSGVQILRSIDRAIRSSFGFPILSTTVSQSLDQLEGPDGQQ